MKTSSPRKTSSTATVQFSAAARDAGLYLRGISQAAVHLLARIQSEPIPMQKRQRGKNIQPSPSRNLNTSIGPLISNGLAVLRNELYVTTPKGNDYLAKMKGSGLLKTETTTPAPKVGSSALFCVGLPDMQGGMCWLAGYESDPTRYYTPSCALTFKTWQEAADAIERAKKTHPFKERSYRIMTVAEMETQNAKNQAP